MWERSIFRDRAHAGALLAEKLGSYANRPDVIVLALPRGGVPVGFEVARAINAPLDVFIVRKLGVPFQPELAMGAIATGGIKVINNDVVESLRITSEELDSVAERELAELHRRERVYRGDRQAPVIEGKTIVLVDDGIATGTTMRAAIKALRKQNPARIVAAVAVGPRSTFEELKEEVDEVVSIRTPETFYAISPWYEEFSQTTDEEVRDLLAKAASRNDTEARRDGGAAGSRR
ncbi:MAG TPA: phosphoribosyltransferase [Blastocatellia bacterium]|nr:phosphoribosyltransferase [Blastocatellia bacterium]